MNSLPAGWTRIKIEELAASKRYSLAIGPFGSSLKVVDYRDSGIPLVFVREIRGESFGGPKTRYVLSEKAAELSAHAVYPGDLLVTKMGDPPGDTAIYPEDRPSGIITADCIKMTVGTAASSLFLKYWLRCAPVRDRILDETKGVAQQKLSLERFRKIEIELPPIGEQRRILTKLEALTSKSRRAKEALDAIPALLERFRQSVLAAAFRGDLTADWREKNPDVEPAEELLKRIRAERRRRWEEAELAKMRAKGKVPGDDRWKEKYEEPAPVDASELPELPEGWAWATWAQVGLCQNGRPFPSSEYTSSGIKLLRPGNLHVDGRLEWTPDNTKCLPERWTEENSDHVIRADELVMNLTAQSLKDEFLGRVCLSSPGERCLLNQRLARLTPLMMSARFCLWLFKSPLVRAYIDELNTGSLIQHMFTSQVNRFVLPIPPADEQIEIAIRIDAMLDAANRVRLLMGEGGARLSNLDRAILAKAFRGELVPQDPNDEPASVLLERLRAEREQNRQPTKGAGRRRAAESPPPVASNPTALQRKPDASRRSQAAARSRG